MNCPNCGAVFPQGAQQCPACGMFVAATADYGYAPGFDPTAYRHGGAGGYGQPGFGVGGYVPGYDTGSYPQAGYGQAFDPGAYQEPGYGNAPYQAYPQGYPTGYGANPAVGGGALANAIVYLPKLVMGLVRNPGEALQGLIERGDVYTGGLIALLSLVLSFFNGLVLTRGAVSLLFGGLSGILGVQLAGDAASMNQGVNYIAGRISVSIGGIAVLCQLFAIVLPAAVALVYLCAVRKVRFSFLLASNLVAVTTLPSLAAALLCMVFSLMVPALGLVAMGLGLVVSYVLLGLVVSHITGMPEQHSAGIRITLISISEVVKLLFVQLIGGALVAGTLHTVSSLVGTIGSLL